MCGKPRKYTPGAVIGRLLRYLFYAVILFIYGAILTRSLMSCDIPLTKEVLINDKFLEAYNRDGENFEVLQYGMKDAYVRVADGRLITFDKLYYIPAAEQLQLSVKYNTDIVSHAFSGDIPFRFYLKDEDGKAYDRYAYKSATRFQYGYIRLCFEDISLSEKRESPAQKEDGAKKYTIFIELVTEDGEYRELIHYTLYYGSTDFQRVAFQMED